MAKLDNEVMTWIKLDSVDETERFEEFFDKKCNTLPVLDEHNNRIITKDNVYDNQITIFVQADKLPMVKDWIDEWNNRKDTPFYVDDHGKYVVNSKLMAKAIERMTDEQFWSNLWWNAAGCGQYIVPFDYDKASKVTQDMVMDWNYSNIGKKLDECTSLYITDVMFGYDDDGIIGPSACGFQSVDDTWEEITNAITEGRLHKDDKYITTRYNEDCKIYGAKSPKELARIAYPELYHKLFEQDGVCSCWDDRVDDIDFNALLKDEDINSDDKISGYNVVLYDDIEYGDSFVDARDFNNYEDAKAYAIDIVNSEDNITSADVRPIYKDENGERNVGEYVFTYKQDKIRLCVTKDELKLIKDLLTFDQEFAKEDRYSQDDVELYTSLLNKIKEAQGE